MNTIKLVFGIIPLLFTGIMVAEMQVPIKKAMTNLNASPQEDGPYVLYKNDKVFVSYVFEKGGIKTTKTDSVVLAERSKLSLTVATDIPGKIFTVRLKDKLQNEKSDFRKAGRQLAISDIEGSFSAFRKLLQGNRVIDENYNWIFGDGHLVLTGDFFDRGDRVTEVLWLIYSLEDKAKAAGGYVHFVLGNHEIMNLNGDLRYVHPKYFHHASLLNENYMTLYGEQSELGRWLRTKNVIQKVGDVLYVHGGVSAIMNTMELPVAKVNELVRPFYADTSYVYPNAVVDLLYSDLGPFWYRGYYTGSIKATQQTIDSTLHQYRARYIATGHTIIADTISTLFDKKVFNTDVQHYKGHSEALYIEKGKFYRTTVLGEKFLIRE
ncbi:MAG TPA: metallophosphoesterase [Chitinophagaceae bacterium]|nr:metallophosphoesterase [Chitinophagaceae bacterium]HNU13618.1 metallophosphoesterase [Chitinophagaceae bacterium]